MSGTGVNYFGGYSDFDLINIKSGMKVKFDLLNNFSMFGSDQVISGLALTCTKKFR